MGFPGKPEPYPLSPLEMTYALVSNPYIVPHHTFAAYGSVTEPFLPETWRLALSYIKTVYEHLKLPSQVSTKALLTSQIRRGLKDADPNINVLISITALGDIARKLEPRAPLPEERLEYAGIAAREGLSVTLFLRPIIPGVTDRMLDSILKHARSVGLKTVVLGSLRVTPGILKRLESLGIRIPEWRIPRYPRSKRTQVTINVRDIKDKAVRLARAYGLIVLPTACSANVYSHRIPCNRCKYGPCYSAPHPPTLEEVADSLNLLNVKCCRVERVSLKGIYLRGKRPGRTDEWKIFWIREVSGLQVFVNARPI
jgi:DNA repair photolyase